jgi:PPOX class probable FMN-dependent enzyme
MVVGRNGNGARFQERVTSEAELRAIMGEVMEISANKVVSSLDDYCRRFIAASPFVLIATSNGAGEMDISPKGDPAGFVRVLDDKTLAIPDRSGNRRLDTFTNVLENPRVGLIFIVPGTRETLRVSGTAEIVRDEELRTSMAVNARVPQLALVVSVERALFHCSKCMIRSHLWEPETWLDRRSLPSLAEIMMAHAKPKETLREIDDLIETDARESLY